MTERRERFRAILARNELVYPAPVYDPISARIADMLGFEIGFIAGSEPAASELCAPTGMTLITSTELAELVHRITRVSTVSLLVVAENGYGNALNVMRTVEELETAGVAALTIEDTVLPPAFGAGAKSEEMIPLDEAVGKMKAAIAARRDRSLAIVGRTGRSLAREIPIPETVRRVKAYEKAGVDVIHLSGATTREAIEAVHAETRLPLMVSRLSVELEHPGFLAAHGVRLASVGHLTLAASVKAVHDTLEALRDGRTQSELRPSVASPELMAEVTRQAQYNECIREFLN